MITTPIPLEPMKAIAIDLVGPLLKTERGNRFILTVTDQLTKYAIAVPLADTSSRKLMETLEDHVFYPFGPPSSLLSDNGRNLTSAEIENFFESWGVTHITTTPYHPMSNGMVERFNGTLAILLTNNLQGDVKMWDQFLNASVFAYNSSIHQSTGYTPFFLMTGKFTDSTPLLKIGCRPSKVSETSLLEARKQALERILRSQKLNQRNANENRVEPNFKIGDYVLLLIKPRKRLPSQKLLASFSGPHKIVQKLSANVFEILSLEDRKKRIENVANLKKYFDRKDFALVSEQTADRIPANVSAREGSNT